jgi:tetratricopeptide (TPR) repeat protein
MLYELLTGRPPFMGETGHDTLRQIVEDDPAPPTRLQNRVPRDLETIALKCLEKEPSKRYASANELADDLHRYLTGEPIRARPVSRRERAVKWARRHPTATALLFVVAASLVALIAGNAQLRRERDRAEANLDLANRERDRAETNLELAMRAVDGMLSEVGEVQLATEPRMEEKRRALLIKALGLHREFMKERGNDSRVRFSTAEAYRRLGDVRRLLDQHDEALAAYDRALALLGQLRADAPLERDYRQQTAHCRNFQGEVYRAAEKHQDAEQAYREASELEGDLARDFPDEPQYRQDLARTLNNLGLVLRKTGEPAQAERQFLRSAELLAELVKQFPDNERHRQLLGRAYLNLGTVIPKAERFDDVQDAYDRAISLLRPLTEKHPEQPDYQHELAAALNNMGNLLAIAKRFEDAQKLNALAKFRFAALVANFPNVLIYRQELANTCNSIGNVAYWLMDYEGALRDWSVSRNALESLLQKRPGMLTYQSDLGTAHFNLGLAHHKLGQNSLARENLTKSIEILEKLVASEHASYETLHDSYHNLAEVLVESGDHAAAAAAAREVATTSQSAVGHYNSACFLARCVPLAEADKQLDAEKRRELGETYADQSVAALRAALDKGFADLERLQADQATVLASITSRPAFQEVVQQVGHKLDGPSR